MTILCRKSFHRFFLLVVLTGFSSTDIFANEGFWSPFANSMLDGGAAPTPTCGGGGGCHGSNANTAVTRTNAGTLVVPTGATTFTITSAQLGIASSKSWALRYKVNGITSATYVQDEDGASAERKVTIPASADADFEYCVGDHTPAATSPPDGSARNMFCSSFTVTHAVPAPVGSVAFINSSFTGSEDASNARVVLSRTGGSAGPVTATVAASPGSASIADYSGSSFSVTWSGGQSGIRNLDIPIVDDSLFEGTESFAIEITGASGGAGVGSIDRATVNITDNDAEPEPGIVSMTATSFDGSEDDKKAEIILRRSGGSDGAVSATVTASAGSAGTSDYTGTSFTASWAAGQSGTQTISIPIVDDNNVEGSETFTVRITSASGGATISSADDATVTILDNDDPDPTPGVVSLTASTYDGSEDDGVASITLRRAGGSDGAITATVTATAGTAGTSDFTGTTFTANWNAGQAGTRTITVPVVDDAEIEGTETFSVQITSASGGATISTARNATVAILDNDDPDPAPGSVSLTANSFDGSEDDEVAVITLRRSGGSDGTVSATVTATTGTADTSDFTGSSFNASWGSGQSGPRTISIPIVNDTDDEGSESFSVELTSVSGGAGIGATSSAVVTILDNDGTEPPSSTACTAFAETLASAKLAYAHSCSLPRVDCDPMNDGWLCSSEQIGSGRPAVAVEVSGPYGEACVAVGRTLAIAKTNYANSCVQRRRDCDPFEGQWLCSSQVIGNNAPALYSSVAPVPVTSNSTSHREIATTSAACPCMNDTVWADAFFGSVSTGEFGQSVLDSAAAEVDVTVYRGAEQSLLAVSYSDSVSVATCAVGRVEEGAVLREHLTLHSANYDSAARCADWLIEDSVPQPGWIKVEHQLQIDAVDQLSSNALSVNGYPLLYPEAYRVAELSLDEVMTEADLVYQSPEACVTNNVPVTNDAPLGVILTSRVVEVIDNPDFAPVVDSTSESTQVEYHTCDGQLIGVFTFPGETWIPFARNGGQILRGSRLTD